MGLLTVRFERETHRDDRPRGIGSELDAGDENPVCVGELLRPELERSTPPSVGTTLALTSSVGSEDIRCSSASGVDAMK
ncbi:hypothetical protein VB773_06555 [Haloarculaceae archaeon H-GB2-1]|nr:hypothetical protein [Haloarculaceae archaeon H-GB1-1]MEA5385759.1 hypothetical protein [Haloarculaceae archaeon H-GB11]MEA5407264.1 hypothetical protein [Haloarculaceae archaeon H-GB2-1]